MSYNTPTFAKRENPIKSAIIDWLEDQFRQSPQQVLVFRMGDLEAGIKIRLSNPALSSSTIRTHTSNLVSAKPRFIEEITPPEEEQAFDVADQTPNGIEKSKRHNPRQDKYFSISRDQMERLLAIREQWKSKTMSRSSTR